MSNMLKPTDFRLSTQNGITSIDKFDLEPEIENVFAKLGVILENYFTMNKQDFSDV